MSTTASPASSEPSLEPRSESPTPVDNSFDVTGLPAVAVWMNQSPHTSSQQSQSWLANLKLDLHYHAPSNKAFLKLSTTPISFKAASQKTRIPAHVFVRPEHIQQLRLDESQIRGQEEHGDAPWKSLGPETFCLHFSMRKCLSVVVPRLRSLAPRNKSSGAALDSLRELQEQHDLWVYVNIPRKDLTSMRLQSFCDLISNHNLESIATHNNLATCYNGRGGNLLPRAATASSVAHPVDEPVEEHPPSYDELAPSSPPSYPSMTGKRRRRQSSPPTTVDHRDNKSVAASLVSLEATLSSRLLSLQTQIDTLSSHVDTRLDALQADMRQHVDEAVDNLREELQQDTAEKMEDEYLSIKNTLDDYIQEEVGQARDAILEKLSGARMTLHVDDD